MTAPVDMCSDLQVACACLTGDRVLAARLKLVGSCRGPGDVGRVESLRLLAEQLGIADSVDW